MMIFSLHKKQRINPHTLWAVFCSAFIIALIVLLAGSSWYFMQTSQKLDAPVSPIFDSNASKIQEMQQTLDIVEKAVEKRTKQ